MSRLTGGSAIYRCGCTIHGEGAAVVSTWDYVPEEAKPLDGEVIGVDVLPKGVKP